MELAYLMLQWLNQMYDHHLLFDCVLVSHWLLYIGLLLVSCHPPNIQNVLHHTFFSDHFYALPIIEYLSLAQHLVSLNAENVRIIHVIYLIIIKGQGNVSGPPTLVELVLVGKLKAKDRWCMSQKADGSQAESQIVSP